MVKKHRFRMGFKIQIVGGGPTTTFICSLPSAGFQVATGLQKPALQVGFFYSLLKR
jgi:hypothetical protein